MQNTFLNPRSNLLTRADKKNIVIGSLILLFLGLVMLVFILKFTNYPEIPWVFIEPLMYTISGFLGLYGILSNDSRKLIYYQIALGSLIAMNVSIIIASIVLIIVLLLNPNNCDSTTSENCGIADFVYDALLVISFGSVIISSVVIAMVLIFYKHVKKFKEANNYFELAQI